MLFRSISKELNNKFDKSFEIDEDNNKKEFLEKEKYLYPKESDNKILFTLIILTLPTLFIGFLGAPFPQGQAGFDLLSQCLYPILKNYSEITSGNWSEFLLNAINSLSIVILGIFIAFILYGPISFFPQNLEKKFEFLLQKNLNPFISFIYNWSYFRGYIDFYYDIVDRKSVV